jgi:hypothetical protein
MDNKAIEQMSCAHANITVFDLIATICENSIRGASLTPESLRGVDKIREIALKQRQAQFRVYDAAEKSLRASVGKRGEHET